MDTKNQARTASWINVIAGVWLIVAPFILGYSTSTPRTNDIWMGVIIGILALIHAFTPSKMPWVSWLTIIAGAWLIIAPFVLGYDNTAARWNDVILGIVVAGVAIWGTTAGGMSSSARHRVSV